MDDLVRNAGGTDIADRVEEKNSEEKTQGTMDQRLDLNQSYIKIAEDSMAAWLFLVPPEEEKYSSQEIKEFLCREGVVAGYHESNIAAMVHKEIYHREILVAKGSFPVEGKDGYFEYAFEIPEEKAPEILEDGTVDYTTVNKITNVRPGDKLATYHPATAGTNGMDVRGVVTKAAVTKELPPLRGAGISKQDTEDTYFADKEGKVELRDGKLDIKSTHEISGDVDQTIGKIEFFGDVIVNGSVESGVTIRAGRNIEIRGSVEAASLFAGGDIILQRGIQGQQRAKVSARGSIFAKFIEQTIITAGGDVYADSIMNSRIAAEGKVILSGKRGVLVGGYTHALLGIQTVMIGNEAEARTVVHVGCEAEFFDKAINLKKKETAAKKRLEELAAELEEIKRKALLYGDKAKQMIEEANWKIEPQEKELEEEITVLLREQEDIRAHIQKGKGARVVVDGNIYRGTVICIAQLQMPVENNGSFMNYSAQGGLIVGNVIVH